ncbi:hypothetical protein J7L48_10045, partial [bacterium]|nr:hypothetical protein [bacterium]
QDEKSEIIKEIEFKISEISKKKMKKKGMHFHFANNQYFFRLSLSFRVIENCVGISLFEVPSPESAILAKAGIHLLIFS